MLITCDTIIINSPYSVEKNFIIYKHISLYASCVNQC